MAQRIRATAAKAAIVLGVLLPGMLVVHAPFAGAASLSTTDPAGDTATDAVGEPFPAPAGDIVATSAESTPETVTLRFRVGQPVDPMADPNWQSEWTSAVWHLDVNGDNKRDYQVEYYRDADTKKLTADLYRSGGPQPGDDCQLKPSYTADAGYTTVIETRCLAGATDFSYKIKLDYDTDAKSDDVEVVTDSSPDNGWFGAGGVTGASPPPVAPLSKPDAPKDPGAEGWPEDPASPSATAPSGATAPTSGTVVTSPGQKATTTRPGQQVKQPSAQGITAPTSVSPAGLAHTGLSDRLVRLGVFAVGILLIGIGLLFANKRSSSIGC